MADKNVIVFIAVLAVLIFGATAVIATKALTLTTLLLLALSLAVLYLLSPKFVVFREYERGVVFRLGKFTHVVGPGPILFFQAVDRFVPVELRTKVIDTLPQHVETKDNVSVKIDAITYVRITDPAKVVLKVRNLEQALNQMLVAEIRNTIAKMPLEALMEKTEDLNTVLISKLKEVEETWGFVVLRAEIVSIELPPDIIAARHAAMSALQYKQKLETEAKARQVSIETLDSAVSKISDKTLAYLYLDALKKMADGRANKILFPLELTDLAKRLSSKMDSGPSNYDAIARNLIDAFGREQKTAASAKSCASFADPLQKLLEVDAHGA